MSATAPDFFAEQVLRLRAERLAAPRERSEERPAGTGVLCFQVAGETYALPLDALAEVMPLAGVTPVPGQAQHLLGVTNVRGEIRPVLNLHVLLGLAEPAPNLRCYGVFLRAGGREVGLRADLVERIRFIDEAGLTLPHRTANGLPQRFVAGITPDTTILLDPAQILALDVLRDRRTDPRRAT
ncbi:chemotaxis protein CheW [Magnetospirillum sp. UT-4]|uniref:chemotaxis protein CheW n=1 Tax=Magnetospirillum sp. UT-4 TaxID=2681467 RepID=UPI00137F3793|nr:chemotaxis protein CheW [Magnetospirillum sp. UT-4]CAA7615201.1 CheW-like protein [Magnetospirillum sp. UT-4]